jgi:DNA-binding transcriptional ArsR family regulator
MTGKIDKMSNDPMCDLLGRFFTTLSHRTRMRIFCAIQSDPMRVTGIATFAGITIANASQHLRLMRENGTVASEKRGQSVYYRIADRRFLSAASLIREALVEQMQSKTRSGRRALSKNTTVADFIAKKPRPARGARLSTHLEAYS